MKNLSLKAVGAGVGVILAESFVFSLVFGFILLALGRDFYSYGSLTINALMSLCFYLSGGFLAARMAGYAVYAHAVNVWLGAEIIALVLSLLFPGQYPLAYLVACALLECAATLAGAYICANALTHSPLKNANPRQG